MPQLLLLMPVIKLMQIKFKSTLVLIIMNIQILENLVVISGCLNKHIFQNDIIF